MYRAKSNSCSASVKFRGFGFAVVLSVGSHLAVSERVSAVGERRGCSPNCVVVNTVLAGLYARLHPPMHEATYLELKP